MPMELCCSMSQYIQKVIDWLDKRGEITPKMLASIPNIVPDIFDYRLLMEADDNIKNSTDIYFYDIQI